MYTQTISKIGFCMRQLRSKFLVFARALPIGQWPHPKDDASLGTPGWSLVPDTKICAAAPHCPVRLRSPASHCESPPDFLVSSQPPDLLRVSAVSNSRFIRLFRYNLLNSGQGPSYLSFIISL